MIRFVFPGDVLNPKKADEAFADQLAACREAGFATSILSIENLQLGKRRATPPLEAGETVVYRGWMMSEQVYGLFCEAVVDAGATPLTDLSTYLSCHHLPNWYPLVREWTPKTVVFPPHVDLKHALDELAWDGYFIKDYVKSLKTRAGALLRSSDGVEQLVADMIRFRGEIEGGFCVREVEDFDAQSEVRYFVIGGRAFASDSSVEIPEIVVEAASRIPSQFFSVDLILRADGVQRIVEVGDGQVSDIVGWTPERLVEAFSTYSLTIT